MLEEQIILRARFDPKLKTYWFLNAILLMLVTFIAIPVIPFWILGLGQYICNRRYEHLKAELTDRSLHLRSGYLFKVEKHVPLDKIQDLTLREGPILRALGLSSVSVETAGNSAQGQPDASLVGVIDSAKFRNAVLEQREKHAAGAMAPAAAPVPAPAPAPAAVSDDSNAVLTEIRDTLLRIEQQLRKD